MGTQHFVVQGEHLSGIAEQHGFRRMETILSAPENADFRALRKNPHTLLPGDVIAIPTPEERSVTRPTGAMHAFVLLGAPLVVRVAFHDVSDQPIAGAPCTVEIEEGESAATTDGDGLLEVRVNRSERFFEVVLGELEIPVRIGHLDPIDEPTGWQGRLKNLGFYAGLVGADLDDVHMRLAVEEFQFEQGLPVTGEVDDATQAALLDAHGC